MAFWTRRRLIIVASFVLIVYFTSLIENDGTAIPSLIAAVPAEIDIWINQKFERIQLSALPSVTYNRVHSTTTKHIPLPSDEQVEEFLVQYSKYHRNMYNSEQR